MIHVTIVEWYGLAALFLVCALVAWRGEGPERRTASVVAFCWIASVVVDNDASRGVQWAILGVDVFLGGWLVFQALTGNRAWLYVAAGAQILILLTHAGFALSPEVMQEGFFSAYYIWSYVVLAAIATGSLSRHGRVNETR